jgi:hypothetical protein
MATWLPVGTRAVAVGPLRSRRRRAVRRRPARPAAPNLLVGHVMGQTEQPEQPSKQEQGAAASTEAMHAGIEEIEATREA